MRRAATGAIALLLSASFVAVPGVVTPAGAQVAPGGGTRAIPAAGTTSIRALPFGAEGLQQPELRQGRPEEEGDAPGDDLVATTQRGEAGQFNRANPAMKGGSPFPKKPLNPPKVNSSALAVSDAAASVPGLNHRDQRLANNGNQFSLEPPDQALCAGNGFVVEAVNSVIRVHDRSGAVVAGVQDLNTFLGYPAAIDRTTGVIGPQVIDVICHYDPDSNRFMVADTTLGSNPDGSFTGKNTIDLAVSN
ncbi:MAG TPA: hypothetical protein VKB57_00005, partial [Acidimicrobiales bacterium]|nr:hypothetical protein [Acidimicrobiales bacterium]